MCTCRLVKPSNTSYPIMIQTPPRPSTWSQLLRDRSSAAFPNDSNEAESLYPDAHFPQPLGERCGKRVRQYGAVSIFRQYSETPKSYSLAWCDTPEFGRQQNDFFSIYLKNHYFLDFLTSKLRLVYSERS